MKLFGYQQVLPAHLEGQQLKNNHLFAILHVIHSKLTS